MSNEKAKRFRELNSDYDWCADETFSNYYIHTDDVDSLMQDYSDDQNADLKAENERLKKGIDTINSMAWGIWHQPAQDDKTLNKIEGITAKCYELLNPSNDE